MSVGVTHFIPCPYLLCFGNLWMGTNQAMKFQKFKQSVHPLPGKCFQRLVGGSTRGSPAAEVRLGSVPPANAATRMHQDAVNRVKKLQGSLHFC